VVPINAHKLGRGSHLPLNGIGVHLISVHLIGVYLMSMHLKGVSIPGVRRLAVPKGNGRFQEYQAHGRDLTVWS
jgi:hypothetical protein